MPTAVSSLLLLLLFFSSCSTSALPYTVTQHRANGARPFISSHNASQSAFNFNLVPAFLTLPNGQPALLVRSVNGTSYQMTNGTASTTENPDQITLTTFSHNISDDAQSIAIEPIVSTSVVFPPDGSKYEACGVQDPRVVFNPKDQTYYMTYAAYANPLPVDPTTNPKGILCGDAWLGLATSKTPSVPGSWQRRGYNCGDTHGKGPSSGVCGKSAAILIRDKPPHYMFWGIPTISIAVSDDLVNWKHHKSAWVTPDAKLQEMWVEAGSPPEKLSDGNYIMTYNIADSKLWWGVGYLILDATDPTVILQRGSHLIWPSLPWEWGNTTGTAWEPYKNCIGAMNSLHALPKDNMHALALPKDKNKNRNRNRNMGMDMDGNGNGNGNGNTDTFLGYYVAGDAVSGAATITVTRNSNGWPPHRNSNSSNSSSSSSSSSSSNSNSSTSSTSSTSSSSSRSD